MRESGQMSSKASFDEPLQIEIERRGDLAAAQARTDFVDFINEMRGKARWRLSNVDRRRRSHSISLIGGKKSCGD
jgi:hypothetical protein